MRIFLFFLTCLIALPAAAVNADDAGMEFFEKRIRPLLIEHCLKCHAQDAKKLGGGLLLDSRDGVQKGGDSGAVVVPGKPDESLLIKAVRYTDPSVQMPPKGKLPAQAVADLEEWVRQGALDPRDKPVPAPEKANSWEETFRIRARWWSLQPVQDPPVPLPKQAEWSNHPVDRFLLARLEQEGLAPAPAAEPATLIRRLSLVLTGLPPAAADTERFVREWNSLDMAKRKELVEVVVDGLLNSPQFGERWARHWMDIVRFTETHGNEWNYEVHHAWRYRDYLIRAFNADVPYDQFIREHIAGDLLSPPRWNKAEQFNESVIGTGFYRFGEVNHDDCISLPALGYDILDNQIDTLTKAFQATTVACARCHDHKLDAVSMRDYYALLGVLRSSRLVSHSIDAPQVNAELIQRLSALKQEIRQELGAVWLRDVPQVSRYLQAAAAKRANNPSADELAMSLDAKRLEKWVAVLAQEKAPIENLFEPLRLLLAASTNDASSFSTEWKKVADRYASEEQSRREFNATQFDVYAGAPDTSENDSRPLFAWDAQGQGLRGGPGKCGDFALNHDGERLVRAILPAGYFTHAVSDKLNGTLRSPVLAVGKKHISFQVIGQRSSAVRLVSNHCQLNYKNYRALTSSDWHWETFSPPDNRESLQTYAELMTMLDNPKFPDQLSALGGDKENYRLPWDKAAENPRSYFGVTKVVLHDGPEPPKPELSHFRGLFAANPPESEGSPQNFGDATKRFEAVVATAVQAFAMDQATDEHVRWLDALLQQELLPNQITSSPRLNALVEQYRRIESQLALPRIIAGIGESGGNFTQPVFVRGDCTRPGENAPHRYLEVLSSSGDSFATAGSGRLELADRIASPRNPLTARVMVNRIWHHLFGAGIVRTVDDFGQVGELPTHPELLDYLAARFIEGGWSTKWLIRSLVLTRTFQSSNQPSDAARERDPRNLLLHHYPARRMEGEAIRDSILAVSGRLDRKLFGPSVQPFREQDNADRRLFAGPLDGNGRRSLYIKNNLMERPKFLETFNFPGGKVTQGRRDVTNVPAQALALLNDPFVLQQADLWGTSLSAHFGDSFESRIGGMFQLALNRTPTSDELQRFEQTAFELAKLYQVRESAIMQSQPIWRDLGHAMFNLKEFVYIP